MKQLHVDTLLEIEELFKRKKWNGDIALKGNSSLFNRFCERLKLFSDDQQKLIIELTEKYTWIQLQNYLECFYDSLILLGDQIYDKYDYIYVCPLLDPNKPGSKTKSGGFLHYMFESDDYTWLSEKFVTKASLKYLYYNFKNSNSLLLLIDDFVGSGETAITITKKYLSSDIKEGKIDPKNIKIVSIAAQNEGISTLKNTLNIEVISAIKLSKGISDCYSGENKNSRISLMKDIENILGVHNDYKLGYKESESLITLLYKSPNNTFPVYWLETKEKMAPFPRQKKFRTNGK